MKSLNDIFWDQDVIIDPLLQDNITAGCGGGHLIPWCNVLDDPSCAFSLEMFCGLPDL